MDIFNTVVGVIMGGGVLAFIQFLITRHDSKHDKMEEVNKSIHALSEDMKERFDALDNKIDAVESKTDEYYAVSCRVRILRFEDEIQSGIRHSKDAWDQCMSDCKSYEEYANAHESFRNNITEATVEHIQHGYRERLEKRDFTY